MIEKLRQLEKQIVPAPWKHDLGNWDIEGPNREEIVVRGETEINQMLHLQFIQDMRNALPKFLALYDAANAAPIREQWDEEYCHGDSGDELIRAGKRLNEALKALEKE